jgi:transposase
MLYEAAHIMLVRSAKWSWLKAWARKIARRRGLKMSAVSTYETDLAVLGREDFWLIVAFRGSEDETEIHSG